MPNMLGAQDQIQDGDVFDKFPELPLELRQEIWGMSAPPPQLIRIYACREKLPCNFGASRDRMLTRALYKVPSMLHTNKESREVAKTIYRFEFADRLGGNGVWMDISKDILYFRIWDDYRYFFGRQKSKDWGVSRSKPMPENLLAVAFSPRFFNTAAIMPQMLKMVGQPKIIYVVESEPEVRSCCRWYPLWTRDETTYQRAIDKRWDLIDKDWVKVFFYAKPKALFVTENKLKAVLAASIPPVPKRNRLEPNIAKVFLEKASFYPVL